MYTTVKSKLLLKIFIGLPIVIFIDFVLMAILECTSCLKKLIYS